MIQLLGLGFLSKDLPPRGLAAWKFFLKITLFGGLISDIRATCFHSHESHACTMCFQIHVNIRKSSSKKLKVKFQNSIN